ncbi:SAM-dependent methyltransferase [Lysobacter sp. CA196]|uniref:SAM-dependent methyltransferase n=1 Tax=Lysobacter sp. CA196 TaxID=3455606 RepID=UPI003F8D0D55
MNRIALQTDEAGAGQWPITAIRGASISDYQAKVEYTYQDDPQDWRKVIGNGLLFQFGVYDDPGLPQPASLDESGIRYFDRQLQLAGYDQGRTPVERILDIGCGWGSILTHLAGRFPECRCLDGINVSRRQLEHGAQTHAELGLSGRIGLYQCNAKDIDLLPDADRPYDLVVMRGVISHFPNDLYETVMAKLRRRVHPDSTVIVSDNLYNIDLEKYRSDTADIVDRLACKYRKTPRYFSEILERSGFGIRDMRVLPSNADAIRWLLDIRANIEKHFPLGADGALEELHVMTESLAVAIVKNQVSIYSAILKPH